MKPEHLIYTALIALVVVIAYDKLYARRRRPLVTATESKLAWKRVAFWGAVAVVAVAANFGVELLADKFPQSGLRSFVAYTHKGKA